MFPLREFHLWIWVASCQPTDCLDEGVIVFNLNGSLWTHWQLGLCAGSYHEKSETASSCLYMAAEFLENLFQAKLDKVCFLILAAPSESIDWTMFAIILNTVWNCKDSCLYSWSTLVLLNLNNLIVFRIILNTVWNCKFLSLSSSRTFGRFILGLLDVSFGINLSRSSKPTDLVDCAQGSYYQQSEIVNSFLWIAA